MNLPAATTSDPGTITVLVVDDQALVRAGFRMILEIEPDLQVVGEAADGGQAVSLAASLQPDVVLMDVRMPGIDGIAATRTLTTDPACQARVVMLTTFDMDEFVYGAMRAGVAGFLVKDTDPEDLIRAVRVAARGDALISPSVTRRLIAQYAGRAPRPAADPRVNALTPRERELVTLVAEFEDGRVLSGETAIAAAGGRILKVGLIPDRPRCIPQVCDALLRADVIVAGPGSLFTSVLPPLLGFGVHGFTHIAMALAARRYVTGVATAPTVVIPFWLWARRELARAGVRDDDRAAVLAAIAAQPDCEFTCAELGTASGVPKKFVRGAASVNGDGDVGLPGVRITYRARKYRFKAE